MVILPRISTAEKLRGLFLSYRVLRLHRLTTVYMRRQIWGIYASPAISCTEATTVDKHLLPYTLLRGIRQIVQRKKENHMKRTKKCLYCGKEFSTQSAVKKYCCIECAEAAKQEIKKKRNSLFNELAPIANLRQ